MASCLLATHLMTTPLRRLITRVGRRTVSTADFTTQGPCSRSEPLSCLSLQLAAVSYAGRPFSRHAHEGANERIAELLDPVGRTLRARILVRRIAADGRTNFLRSPPLASSIAY